MREKPMTCQNCEFYMFHHPWLPDHGDTRYCRRHNRVVPIVPDYWCGDFKAARKDHTANTENHDPLMDELRRVC